jgi:sigma-E factor negative regulatory protein RseA
MEKISQLMDGELGRREGEMQIERLESDQALLASWDAYHLIGDALRREAGLTPGFAHRLHERLVREPTVVAPHTRLSHRVVRYTLPLAAGVAGVTLVAWLALSFQQAGQPTSPTVARAGNAAVMQDYLSAHQEFSLSTVMHGVGSYARTVSNDEPEAR